MKPNEAAKMVGIHVNTVRLWTTNEYRQFFSVSAQGGDGHSRDVTPTDVRILNYINSMKQQGRASDEVVAALMEAERRGFDALPLPTKSDAIVPMAVVPRQAVDEALRAEQRVMRMLEDRIEEYKQQLDKTQSEREEYMRKLVEAEVELRLWRQGKLRFTE